MVLIAVQNQTYVRQNRMSIRPAKHIQEFLAIQSLRLWEKHSTSILGLWKIFTLASIDCLLTLNNTVGTTMLAVLSSPCLCAPHRYQTRNSGSKKDKTCLRPWGKHSNVAMSIHPSTTLLGNTPALQGWDKTIQLLIYM